MDAPTIDCPSFGADINVTPGMGQGGTICVFGSSSESDAAHEEHPDLGILSVLVVVLSCPGGVCPSAPANPLTAGGTFASINGDGTWCAQNVNVPNCSAAGSLSIVFGWMVNNTGSGMSVVSVASAQEFNACQGKAGAIDCCSSGPCTGNSDLASQVLSAVELKTGLALQIAVPNGAHAGLHTARMVSQLTWSIPVARDEFLLTYCCMSGLVIRAKSKSTPVESIEFEPFTAIFPGTIFGAEGKVVVTVA
ncbi:MAG TPA: hypothetical protein VG122_10700 [Gemmata sp.]|nr:hypothetical protein [Gemmata sp.]